MRALVCEQLGNPLDPKTSGLKVSPDTEAPKLTPKAVRIKVSAASLNFADALQVQGLYQEKPKLPFIPGSEVSGVVLEVGSSVKSLKSGTKVCAVTSGGALAEEVVVAAAAVFPLPDSADVGSAAGLPVAFGTAHLALKHRACLQSGQTLLVLGAAGGVGVAAVQIARVMGARVIAVARGAEKASFLRCLGADIVLDSSAQQEQPPAASTSSRDAQPGPPPGKSKANREPSLVPAIRKAAPKGVDVVLDCVGGSQFKDAMKCVKWGAHIMPIGFASGSIPIIPANIALVKNLTIHGVYWGSHLQHNPQLLRDSLQELVQWLADGRLQIHVSHRYSLEQATEGFRALLTRKAMGKVLIEPAAQSKL
ncbi:hypothetical protein WJX74_009349 [Apatococcus lobatus]|uniref:Enoyl reductase (ER) domain-containing protein n=1 Tax=Apatococcus lobatus TaxID=904363 RepID=A0AAW1QHL4_9CHLO